MGYDTGGLSLEEAREEYRKIREGFERIRSNYSGPLDGLRGIFKCRRIRKEDQYTLDHYVHEVLPSLQDERSVSGELEQMSQVGYYPQLTLYNQITGLTVQILTFLDSFENTRVTRR